MLSLIKIEINKVSKVKLFLAWLITIFIVSGITGIIIMGLGTDNKLGEFVGQSINDYRGTSQWEGWAIAMSLFTIIIDEFKRRTIFQLFSYPISKIKLLWGKVLSVILISFITHFTAHIVIQLFIKFMAFLTGENYIPLTNYLMNLLGITFGTVLIGLIPFVLGMIKYSTPITILSGLGLAALLSNATPGSLTHNFVDNVFFLIIASVISLMIVSFSIYTISKKDINIK